MTTNNPPVHEPVPASELEAPRAYYAVSSTYIQEPLDFFAAGTHPVITSYTLSATNVSADGNGDKVVKAGTVLQMQAGATGLVEPRVSTNAAVGLLSRTVNLRDANQDVGLVIGGVVNLQKLWDNGVFGSVAARVLTDLPYIQFLQHDA